MGESSVTDLAFSSVIAVAKAPPQTASDPLGDAELLTEAGSDFQK